MDRSTIFTLYGGNSQPSTEKQPSSYLPTDMDPETERSLVKLRKAYLFQQRELNKLKQENSELKKKLREST